MSENLINGVVSISYTEMLLAKNGVSKYMNPEYVYELDPIKNTRLIKLLKENNLNKSIKSLEYVPGINFYKMIIPPQQKIKIEKNDNKDLTSWSKLLSDVKKNSAILKLLIQGLFGISGNSQLDTLSIHNAIGKIPKVIHIFTACPRNTELEEFSKIVQSVMPKYIIRPLLGKTDDFESVTNAKAEEIVKDSIQKSKDENKDGVIIISMNMGSRSFSVSEIDAVVLMFDNGVVASLIQKISRALTGGIDYDGNVKTEGNIISLSLDPNRIDNTDQFIIEECVKHKTKNESFASAIRRIRKSINIFAFDDNGDKENLLMKDDYWMELIDKYNFDELKNNQINLVSIINDTDFIIDLLNINSSDKKRKELKDKLLNSKGDKYLDKKNKNSSSQNNNEDNFSKIDLEKIKLAIKTINNSILSIASIDNSSFVSPSERKTFRNIIYSIDLDNEKRKDFIDLLGIEPSIVIELLNREVINEEIIDICLSKF